MRPGRVLDALCAFGVLSLIGFPAIIVFALGVTVLVYAARFVLIVWIGLAYLMRWAWYSLRD